MPDHHLMVARRSMFLEARPIPGFPATERRPGGEKMHEISRSNLCLRSVVMRKFFVLLAIVAFIFLEAEPCSPPIGLNCSGSGRSAVAACLSGSWLCNGESSRLSRPSPSASFMGSSPFSSGGIGHLPLDHTIVWRNGNMSVRPGAPHLALGGSLLIASSPAAPWRQSGEALGGVILGSPPPRPEPVNDPIFGKPLNFFLFTLPAWNLIGGCVLTIAVISCLLAAVCSSSLPVDHGHLASAGPTIFHCRGGNAPSFFSLFLSAPILLVH